MSAKSNVLRHISLEYRPSKIKFSQDGSRLLIASQHEILTCLVTEASDEVRFEPSFVSDVAFLNNEQVVAILQSPEILKRSQKTLAIYDIKSAQMISSKIAGNILAVSADSHKQRIFAGRGRGPDVEGETGGYLDMYDFGLNLQHTFNAFAPALQMAISHSGEKLATFGTYFELWDVSTSLEPIIKEYPPDKELSGYPFAEVCAGDITPDGRWAAVGVYGGKADCFVVNGETGHIVGWYSPTWSGPGQDIHHIRVAISPDGRFVAIAQPIGPTANVYQVSDGTLLNKYPISGSETLTYSAHGNVWLMGSEICDALAFSPHGDILAVGGEKSVTLWAFEG